jgi:hypothetical protein
MFRLMRIAGPTIACRAAGDKQENTGLQLRQDSGTRRRRFDPVLLRHWQASPFVRPQQHAP